MVGIYLFNTIKILPVIIFLLTLILQSIHTSVDLDQKDF